MKYKMRKTKTMLFLCLVCVSSAVYCQQGEEQKRFAPELFPELYRISIGTVYWGHANDTLIVTVDNSIPSYGTMINYERDLVEYYKIISFQRVEAQIGFGVKVLDSGLGGVSAIIGHKTLDSAFRCYLGKKFKVKRKKKYISAVSVSDALVVEGQTYNYAHITDESSALIPYVDLAYSHSLNEVNSERYREISFTFGGNLFIFEDAALYSGIGLSRNFLDNVILPYLDFGIRAWFIRGGIRQYVKGGSLGANISFIYSF